MEALPTDLLAHAFSFLGRFSDRLAVRTVSRTLKGVFHAWFVAGRGRTLGPTEGMVSLHCDWCNEFTSKDTRIVFKAVPWCLFQGPVFKHCGRADCARGVLRAFLYYARARSYCVTTRPVLEGPVSFVHRGVRVVEGVPVERCYWKDGDGRPHAIVYFSSGRHGVSMVRVPFAVVRASRQPGVWA
jgi:hypothetical protein